MNFTPKHSVTGCPCFSLCYQRGQQQWGWVWRRPLLWGSVRLHASAWHERRDGKVISIRGRVSLCGPLVRLLVKNWQHPVCPWGRYALFGGYGRRHPISQTKWSRFPSRQLWGGSPGEAFCKLFTVTLDKKDRKFNDMFMQLQYRAQLHEMFSAWDP